MSGPPHHTQTDPDEVLAAITNGLVGLHREFYGSDPDGARTYSVDNLVVCVMRGGFTRVEETLLRDGRGEAVLSQRREFQALMRDRYEAIVEHATGRPVVGFMSGNQQDPDMMCEVFVLAPRRTPSHPRRPGDAQAAFRPSTRRVRAVGVDSGTVVAYGAWWRAAPRGPSVRRAP